MIFKLGNILMCVKAGLRTHFSFFIKKDKKAFITYHEDEKTLIEQEYISKIPPKYILRLKSKYVFLSTAFPLFLWEGRSENRAYFCPRIPISQKHKLGFNLNNRCSSGSRLIFTTNSEEIYIRGFLNRVISTTNMPLSSLAGIDVFELKGNKEYWLGCYTPNSFLQDIICCKIENRKCYMRTYIIYMPLFSQLQHIQVGLSKNALMSLPDIKRCRLPIAIYGSSITQGCASSRPSLSYANRLSRQMNCDVLNLGFSGSAYGEKEIARYIGRLDLSAVILEYDHNVSVDALKETHYNFYSIIRASQKQIPIIMFSRCSGGRSISADEEEERYRIIEQTYKSAKSNGDTYIYLLRGEDFFENKEDCFVDDRHPNDIGMKIISERLFEILEQEGKANE